MEGILADGMLASSNLTKYFNLLTFLFTLVIIRNGLASLTQLFMFWFETRTITGKLFYFFFVFLCFFFLTLGWRAFCRTRAVSGKLFYFFFFFFFFFLFLFMLLFFLVVCCF